MIERRRIGLCAIGTCVLVSVVGRAQEPRIMASIDVPATLVATPRSSSAAAADSPARVVLSVVGFTPSSAGPVEAIVTYEAAGEAKVLGHISVFPQAPFDAARPEKTQRFAFPLPDGLAADRPLALTVTVKAARGSGAGAAFVLGPARIV